MRTRLDYLLSIRHYTNEGTGGIFTNMNEVDFIKANRFEALTLQEKLEIKRLGAHQPRDIIVTQTAAGKVTSKAEQIAEGSGSDIGKLKKPCPDESNAIPSSDVGSGHREQVWLLYKLKMPEDLYHFWDFCKGLCPDNPRDALKDSLGLRLVGPFDILAEAHKTSRNPQPNFHLHWRYFYDPPEFQTILQGCSESLHHMGYYRDSPDALPAFVGENEAKKGYTITQMGDNVFAAVYLHLLKKRKMRGIKRVGGGAEAGESLEAKLKSRAESLGYSLEQKTKGMKQREKQVVTKTFHGVGIVVPVDKNDVGYRELPETDAGLKRICKAITEARSDEERIKAFTPLQEMITFVQFANDECDYGMGYELGIDLFSYGSHYLYKVIRQLLPMAYNLLKRNLFGEILEAHISSRSRDNLDQLSAQ